MGERMNDLAGRYEQWKRMDLSALALETMPKQVNKAKVLDDLLRLHSDFEENLCEEMHAELEKERELRVLETVREVVRQTVSDYLKSRNPTERTYKLLKQEPYHNFLIGARVVLGFRPSWNRKGKGKNMRGRSDGLNPYKIPAKHACS